MKKVAKTIGAAFCTALFMLSAMPVIVSAESVKSGDYTYEVQGGDVIIMRYDGDEENVIVPETLDGKKVTAIGSKAFQMNGDLVSVEISDGVKTIGDHAFAIDHSLESITLPATVTDVAEAAFQQCESLTTLNFAGDETTWNAITFGSENEAITALKPNYNVELTKQEEAAASSETASSEITSSAAASSEITSSAAASSEITSSAAASSAATSSVSTASTASAATTTTTTGETSAAEEPVSQGSSVNIAYVVGGILVGIAVLDIIYWSVKKTPEVREDDKTNP